MKRRQFIKSTAIGLGLITVPLMVSGTTFRQVAGQAAEQIDMELSEQALEDLLVDLGKYRDLSIKPDRLIVHPSWYT